MAHRTRVKICGITRLDDALLAERLGVDALGFVFCPASARYIAPAEARLIADRLPSFITCVGLFLDATVAEIEAALDAIPALVPQFHGRESPADCERYGRPYLKAIGVGGGDQHLAAVTDRLAEYKNASAFLFDSNEPGQLGGTGHVFDWRMLDKNMSRPLILAGGLNVHNVAAAIQQVRPWAVDVSSGVEAARGIKDADALRAFTAAVAEADGLIAETARSGTARVDTAGADTTGTDTTGADKNQA
jgi:phosphoribosylanthranilate isomerase